MKKIPEYYTISKHSNTIYDGELGGIVRAIEHAERQIWNKELITILSDNQGALKRLKDLLNKAGQLRVIRAIHAARKLKNR